MASTSKDRIEIGDGFTAEVHTHPSRSKHLGNWFRADEKVVDADGTTVGFNQIVFFGDGSVHHEHRKYPLDKEIYYDANGEIVMIIRNGEVVFQRT